MTISKIISKLSILTVAVAVVGCGSSAPLVGSRSLPDEMAVVSGPPLTLPPSFELRPPQEQKQSRAEALRQQDASVKARTILVGEAADAPTGDVDPWIAEQANVRKADPNIREILDEETNPKTKEEKDNGFLGLFGGDDE